MHLFRRRFQIATVLSRVSNECGWKGLYQLGIGRRTLQSLQKPVPRRGRWLQVMILSVGGIAATQHFFLTSEEKRLVRITVEGFGRFFRLFFVGMSISLHYWWALKDLKEDCEEYKEALKICHSSSAKKIFDACLKNGGIFIKLGQGLCQLNHILPTEYLTVLSALYDKALVRNPSELEQLFREDFNCLPEDMFLSFNRIPVAAASLAQVYKATIDGGEEVAVKVQYIDLRQRFYGDTRTVAFLLRIVKWMHPNFNFLWVMEYLRECLVKELDFVNEAANMEECRRDVAHLPFVYVPRIHWDKSSKRVLTMEFINGAKVSDVDAIRVLGLRLADIDEKVVKTFGEQLFRTGFVHADPHPGNGEDRTGKRRWFS